MINKLSPRGWDSKFPMYGITYYNWLNIRIKSRINISSNPVILSP